MWDTWGSVDGFTLLGPAVLAVLLGLLLWPKSQRYRRAPGRLFSIPLIGEALNLKYDPGGFLLGRYLRYGPVYRSSLLGQDMYFVLEPKHARSVLAGEGVSFTVAFPSFNALVGNLDHMADGPVHSYWRRAMSMSLSPTAVEAYIPSLVQVINKGIDQWLELGRVQMVQLTRQLAVDFALEVLVGIEHTDKAWFREQLLVWIAGLYVAPIDLPFTAFRRAKLARQALVAALAKELEESVRLVKLQADAEGARGAGYLERGDVVKMEEQLQKLRKRGGILGAAAAAVGAAEQKAPGRAGEAQEETVAAGAGAVAAGTTAGPMQQPASGGAEQGGSPEAKLQPGQATAAMGQTAEAAAATLVKDAGSTRAAAADGGAGSRLAASMAEVNLEVLKAQGHLDARAAAERTIELFLAAVDTTKYFVYITMIILSELPEEVEKLRAEQQEVLATHGEELTQQSLAAMPYLDGVLKEAMRLIPAARVGMRRATRDLNFDGVVVPKDSIVVYCIDILHALEPTLWKGPECIPKGSTLPPYMDFRNNLREAFQPERWLKESGAEGEGGRRPRLFATFGGGAHLCLGMNLANTELKLFLASMLRRGCSWEMEVKGLLQKLVVFPFVGTPAGTDWMVFERREELVLQPQQDRM